MQTRIQNGHNVSEMPHDQSIIEQPYGALQVCLFKRIDVHMHNEVYNKPFAKIRIHFANAQKPILVFRQSLRKASSSSPNKLLIRFVLENESRFIWPRGRLICSDILFEHLSKILPIHKDVTARQL